MVNGKQKKKKISLFDFLFRHKKGKKKHKIKNLFVFVDKTHLIHLRQEYLYLSARFSTKKLQVEFFLKSLKGAQS